MRGLIIGGFIILMISVLMCGCMENENISDDLSRDFLEAFLTEILNKDFDSAVEKVLNSSGKHITGEKREKLISLWESFTNFSSSSFEIVESAPIPYDMLASTPFSTGESFLVSWTHTMGENIFQQNTTYFVVIYKGNRYIWLPPAEESILDLVQ